MFHGNKASRIGASLISLFAGSNAFHPHAIPPFARKSFDRLRVRTYSSTQEFESLIQAATSSANGNAMGGDFAGLAATFDPGTGAFIPIPVHLVPDALIEWGQEPKCLEVLVSEESEDDQKTMIRNTITVLPDTGCSIDNLETVKATDSIDMSSKYGKGTNIVGLQYQLGDTKGSLRLESVFGMSDGYRMRVLLDLIPSASVFALQSPMVLTLERRTNTVSSSGTIADGGGLDGRTVSMLLGEKLRSSKTFVEQLPLEENFEKNAIQHVSFPGNISIAYGWLSNEEWVVQIGHVQDETRRVISRKFNVVDDSKVDFDVESWMEDVSSPSN